MQEPTTQPLTELARQFSAYLPTFAAGFLVLLLGVTVGWLVKRTIVRLLLWLRLDRLAGRTGWRTALGKGDVRAALYNVVGSIGMGLVILLFADDALRRWGLQAPSRFIAALLGYLPNLSLGTVITLAGVIIANALGARVEGALREEGLVRARLLARTFKGTLLFVVGALAMWELQFAREIVLGGFLIAFGSLGVAFALAVGLGSAKAIQQGWEAMFAKRRAGSD
jgi:hypothetical protein